MLYIHGGRWRAGSKDDIERGLNPREWAEQGYLAPGLGMTVVSLEGRSNVPTTQGVCLGPDATSARLEYQIRGYATSSDSGMAAMRDSLGITMTTADSVVLVDDEAVCEAAVAALDSLGPVVAGRTVYTWRVGSEFAAHDPNQLAEGNEIIDFF